MKRLVMFLGLAIFLFPVVSFGGGHNHLSKEVRMELKMMRHEAKQELSMCQHSSEWAKEQKEKRVVHCGAVEELLTLGTQHNLNRMIMESIEAEWEADCNSPSAFNKWLLDTLEGCKKKSIVAIEKIRFIDEIIKGE